MAFPPKVAPLSEVERAAMLLNWAANTRQIRAGTRTERLEWSKAPERHRQQCRRFAENAIAAVIAAMARDDGKPT